MKKAAKIMLSKFIKNLKKYLTFARDVQKYIFITNVGFGNNLKVLEELK